MVDFTKEKQAALVEDVNRKIREAKELNSRQGREPPWFLYLGRYEDQAVRHSADFQRFGEYRVDLDGLWMAHYMGLRLFIVDTDRHIHVS